jgi:16S rRNA (guanine(966)-N(2))-methyltransferase RsmD
MRVIAGTHRSRQLTAPKGTITRPTSDRLRETLFNILAARVPDCRFLDLYAGTGAVGIEALSRGAAHVWFTENAPTALASLRANLTALRITKSFTIEDRSTGALLERLAKSPQLAHTIDLVFLDPPYEAAAEYELTLNLLGSARGRQILAPNALVIVEHATKSPLPQRYGALTHTRQLKQGDASLSFYTLPPAAEATPDAPIEA